MNRGRRLIGLMLLAALLATLGMQTFVRDRRETLAPRPRKASPLSGVDTYALGLVLGGLRGPLVMMLWHTIEAQKMEKDLEDIDTKIELIRMLQSDFDQVHIFQIWNKAYNLSVQMGSRANKYATILDAIDYARSVDAERPDNVHILFAIADVYFNKLGTSADKRYYIQRMRDETRATTRPARPATEGGVRRTRHEVLLDPQGRIKAEFLEPRTTPIAGGGPDAYNGAELQYLARYNDAKLGGFPDGVSPLAISYNYYRRTAALLNERNQKHSQLSDVVIDVRPAVALNYWAQEQWERGRRLEIEASGQRSPEDRGDLETIWRVTFHDRSESTRQLVQQALFSLQRAADVCDHSMQEYRRHIANIGYTYSTDNYLGHLQMMSATQAIVLADRAYLAATALEAGFPLKDLSRQDIPRLRADAASLYENAEGQWWLIALRYGIGDDTATDAYPQIGQKLLGKPISKTTLPDAARIYPEFWAELVRLCAQQKRNLSSEPAMEYKTYAERAGKRLKDLRSTTR